MTLGNTRAELLPRRRLVPLARMAKWITAVSLLAFLAGTARSDGIGPQELFRLGGIDEEQFAKLASGEPWNVSGNDILRRMLYRIEKDVRPAELERWSLGDADLERLAHDPGAYQAQVFQLRGRVVLAEPYRLSEDADDPAEFASIWRCRMLLESEERPIEVFAARVPKAWKLAAPIDEPAGALAFFLKASQADGDGPAAYFLASRVAWYPPTHLGKLGMDVALLDEVPIEPPPQRNPDGSNPEIDWKTRQLTENDHECFYQMLTAAGSAEDGQLSRWAQEDLAREGQSQYSVVPLFNQPQTQQGRLVELTGLARRIVPVRVGEPEVIDRFGIHQYYQIYLFTEDSQNNPLVFCLRQLPEGLPTGDGPGFGENITVPGFFLKTWSYQTPAPVTDGKVQRQLAPLLVGKSAVWHPAKAPPEMSSTMRLIGTGILLLVLGSVWWVFRQFGRGDREFERRVRQRRAAEDATMDWSGLSPSDGDDTGKEES